jgi:hypothetical protein
MSMMPKHPCVEIFQCPNIPVSECLFGQNVHVLKRPLRQNVCAEMSLAKMSLGKMIPSLIVRLLQKEPLFF